MRKIIRILSILFPWSMVFKTDVWARIKEGVTTRKEDLSVNWEEFNKYNK